MGEAVPRRGARGDRASSLASPARPPQGFDVTVPNVARIYDHLLGGKDNFEPTGNRAPTPAGGAGRGAAARTNRTSGAAVQFLAREAGIRQFLNRHGLPTRGNVHEIAQITNRRRTSCTPTSTGWWCPRQRTAGQLPDVAATRADLRQPDQLFTSGDTHAESTRANRWPAPGRGPAFPAR